MTKPWAAVAMCTIFLQNTSSATIQASLKPPAARESATAFRLQDEVGQMVRLSDYRGKIVLLNFWATDCGGCVLELPSFVELDDAYRSKGLTVVGVSMDVSYESLKDAAEGWSRVKPFTHSHGMRYPILMGDDAVSKSYHVDALPATYLIDASGRVAATYIGVVDRKNLEANIKSLLAGQ